MIGSSDGYHISLGIEKMPAACCDSAPTSCLRRSAGGSHNSPTSSTRRRPNRSANQTSCSSRSGRVTLRPTAETCTSCSRSVPALRPARPASDALRRGQRPAKFAADRCRQATNDRQGDLPLVGDAGFAGHLHPHPIEARFADWAPRPPSRRRSDATFLCSWSPDFSAFRSSSETRSIPSHSPQPGALRCGSRHCPLRPRARK